MSRYLWERPDLLLYTSGVVRGSESASKSVANWPTSFPSTLEFRKMPRSISKPSMLLGPRRSTA